MSSRLGNQIRDKVATGHPKVGSGRIVPNNEALVVPTVSRLGEEVKNTLWMTTATPLTGPLVQSDRVSPLVRV